MLATAFGRFLRSQKFDLPALRRRALFLLGGVAVGLLAVMMTMLADKAQALFSGITDHWFWAPLIVTPIGFAGAAWLTRRFFDGAQGSGIPQVITARQLQTVEARERLVSVRLAAAKIVLLMLGLACGASAGREGPTVQVGASTMFFLGRIEPHRQPGLLLAGSAAGIAAAFNAPLAGIMFGIEEMSRSFEQRSSVLVLVGVIAAGLTSQAILGDYTYFGVVSGVMDIGKQWLAVIVASVVGGLCGGVFSRTLLAFADGLPGWIGSLIKRHPIVFAFTCGLMVAVGGLFAGSTVFGTGYAQAKLILDGFSMPWLFGPMKLIATALSSISGIPGGLFSPSLAVGAGLGYDFAPLFPQVPIGILAILFMVSYLSGVVQAPLTSAVIVSEMTADHSPIFPIMICALAASAVSRLICHDGVYHALAHRLLEKHAPAEAMTAATAEGSPA